MSTADVRHRATAVIVKDGKVLLFRRLKLGHKYFVFPGGGVEEGETVEDALEREVQEELTLDVKKFRPLFTVDNLVVPDWTTVHVGQLQCHHYFLIEEYTGIPELGGEEKASMNEENQYEIVWFDRRQLEMTPNIFPREGAVKMLTYFAS